jgi:hypothetical protein
MEMACGAQSGAFERRSSPHLRRGVGMNFEGEVFLWGGFLFGKLKQKSGGHVAIVTFVNYTDNKFLELRILPAIDSEVWVARMGGDDMPRRKLLWPMYPDCFPEKISSIVSEFVSPFSFQF